MQQKELKQLITRVLAGGYQSDAYREYRNLNYRGLFSQDNYQDMLTIIQPELKKSDLKNAALVWDIYLVAREEIKPFHPSNIVSFISGMLHKSPYAYNMRALYFWNGIKCDVDYARSHELLLQAKALGYSPAIYNLGLFEQYGLGRKKDDRKARDYFEQAKQLQYPSAYYQLGILVKQGRGGFNKNQHQALALFKTAAELGNKDAVGEIFKLAGEMYPHERSAVDMEQALQLYKIAAEYDHPEALTHVGYIYFKQEKYTSAKLFYERASEFNQGLALNNLGCMYWYGMGVEKDATLAMQYYKRAAKAGHVTAYFNISKLYSKPEFGPNDAKVIKYLEKGAHKNKIECIIDLATYHYEGTHGLQANITKAAELYQQGARLHSVICRYNLAFLRIIKHIEVITEESALAYLDYACNNNYPMACILRAELYVEANQPELATKFYRKALVNRGEEAYENVRQTFSVAQSGSTLQRYHWHMTDVTETLPPEIHRLYQRRPWTIIQALLADDIIDWKSRIRYLTQLPGRFMAHIKELSTAHPIRRELERLYEDDESEVIDSYCYSIIQETELLDKLSHPTEFKDARLPAYLTITILFDAIINDAIDALEMPLTLARIYHCHMIIMRKDHVAAETNILGDSPQQSYMSLDAYLHLLSTHMQLIEAYVTILRQELAKISHLLSPRQSLALVNASGLLMLTDHLLDPNKQQQHPQLTDFSDKIKGINTPGLWLTVKEQVTNTNQQLQLNRALQFFNYSPNRPSSPPNLRRIFHA